MKTALVSSVGTFMPCVNDVGYVREIVATAVDLQVSYEEKAERQQSRISDYITLIIAIFLYSDETNMQLDQLRYNLPENLTTFESFRCPNRL